VYVLISCKLSLRVIFIKLLCDWGFLTMGLLKGLSALALVLIRRIQILSIILF